jgi:hypothetical protein
VQAVPLAEAEQGPHRVGLLLPGPSQELPPIGRRVLIVVVGRWLPGVAPVLVSGEWRVASGDRSGPLSPLATRSSPLPRAGARRSGSNGSSRSSRGSCGAAIATGRAVVLVPGGGTSNPASKAMIRRRSSGRENYTS